MCILYTLIIYTHDYVYPSSPPVTSSGFCLPYLGVSEMMTRCLRGARSLSTPWSWGFFMALDGMKLLFTGTYPLVADITIWKRTIVSKSMLGKYSN